MLKYEVRRTKTFEKDFKLVIKRGYKQEKIKEIISALAEGKALPEKNRDHNLGGDYAGFRECHIEPDWLLIYKIDGKQLILTLTRTGTHSDLF